MRYKLLALYGLLVTLAACTFYAILKLSHQSPEALPLTRCQSDKLYPDLTDCSRFYICSSDGPELFLCPLGFHFNPIMLICDWVDQAGCILNYDASPTILSFETTYTDEIATSITEVSVPELGNEQILSLDLDTKSPFVEPTAKITVDIDNTILNITSNFEKTTRSNNNANTVKISQSPIVNPAMTFTIINETSANESDNNPSLTSINNFTVHGQEILTEISNEVYFKSESTTINPNDSQSSVPTIELDITSDYTIKANRNDTNKYIYNIYTTEVTKNFTHENKLNSTDLVNSEGSNLFENIQIAKTDASSKSTNKLSNESSNTNHSNNDRNSTIISEDIIQNTEIMDKVQFSSDISGFGQHDYDTFINTKSKNDDNIKSHIEIPSNNKTSKYGSYTNINELKDNNVTVPADSINVVAEENATQNSKDTPYVSYESDMKSTEGNFESDMGEETYPNQRVTEELSTVTPTNFYDGYSEIYVSTISVPTESFNNTYSKMHLISTVGQFTDTTSSQIVDQITDRMNSNNSPSAVNPFDENNGQFSISSEIPTNDLYLNNGNSDLATATYSGNQDSKISSSYDGDREITNVAPDNINDMEINTVEESAIDSSTNINENILVSSDVSDNKELPKYETDNVIDNTTNKDFWKESNSVFLFLTSSDENGDEGIITTTTNTYINISASIYSEDLTSEHLNNYLIVNNISIHNESNNDIEYNVVSSKTIDDKTIPYISNREDMYFKIEKDLSHGYTPSVSYSEFVDGTHLNYQNNEAANEITNESFLSSTDFADTFTENTFAINNFYDNDDERVTSNIILLNEQQEASSSTASTNKSIMNNPTSIELVKKNFEIVTNSTKDIVIKFKGSNSDLSNHPTNTHRGDIVDIDDTTKNVLENGHTMNNSWKTNLHNTDTCQVVKEDIFPSTNTSQNYNEANYYTTNHNISSQNSDKENKIRFLSTISSVHEDTVTYDSSIREEDTVDSFPVENSSSTSESSSNNDKDIHIFSMSHSNGSNINLSTDLGSVIISTSYKNTKIFSNNDYLSDIATDAEIDIIDNVQFSTESSAEATKDSGDIIRNNFLPTNMTQEVGDSPFNDIKPQFADVTNDKLNNSEFFTDSDISPKFLMDKNTDSVNSIPLISDLNSTDNQVNDTSSDLYSHNINSENMNKYSSSNSEINIDHQINSSVKHVTEEYFVNGEHITTETILNIDNTENYLQNELNDQNENTAENITTVYSSRNDTTIREHTKKVIPDGPKLTNELGKEDSVLVATTLNENNLKNDPSVDLAQRLKDKILFSSKSKFNMDKPASLEVVQTANLSISTEQITNVKFNHNNNQTFQMMQNSAVAPLQNIKMEKMYTTNLLKTKVPSYQSVIANSNISSNDGSISFINKDNKTIGNHIEQTESMIKATEKFSTSIPNISTNISKEKIYKDKQRVSYIFNKSSIHIALNSSVSHLTQQKSYYSEEKINSIRKQLMQIIMNQYPAKNAIIKNIYTRYKNYGTNDIVDNKYNSDSAKRNSLHANKIPDSKNAICSESNDNLGDKDEEHTDENGNAAYKNKAKGVRTKEDKTGADNINEYSFKKYNNKERNTNENNTNKDDISEENTNKYNTGKGNTKEDHKIENTPKGDKRKEYNTREDSRKEDNIDVNKNTVKDTETIDKKERNNKNKNEVKVSKNKYKLKEANKKDNNIKEDNMKGGYTEEQNKNKDNTDNYNTEEDKTNEENTNESNTSENNSIESKSNENDRLEYNTKEDNTDEYSTKEDNTEEDSTEEDSTEEDNTEEDHAKAYNSFDNNFKDDKLEVSTKENSTEEDDIEESRENRYIKIGKDNIDNDIYKETVEDVESHHSSEESEGSRGDSDSNIEEDTIENVDSKDDSNNVNTEKYNTNGVKPNEANIIGEVIQHELSAIEDIINKTNDELNAEKYYIRRLLQAANSTATNNNDNNMIPLNNRYDRKNKSKYNKKNKDRKLSPEKEVDVRNRQHKYQRKSKQDIGTNQEKYQGRNKHKSNNRNRKWRTLTDEENKKEDNRKHKGKHAFILNIKKVIFEKSLKDINWEL